MTHSHSGHDHHHGAHEHDAHDDDESRAQNHDYGHAHHGHSHHGHAHGLSAGVSHGRAFAIGAALNIALIVAQLGYGIIANSLALVSDALHNISDVLGLLLAWAAAWLATKPPSGRRTYGYRRASILAAVANAALLWLATGAIAIEAIQRLFHPAPVEGETVAWVAALGIAVNTFTALLFMRGRKDDINIGATFMHMAADAAVSFGVVVGALLLMWTGWLWIDPVISLLVSAVVVAGAWRMTRDALDLALDAVPASVDRHAVEAYLAALPGVTGIHDLHIWGMSTTETALTVHLVRPGAPLDDQFLMTACAELKQRFGIPHATIQVEAASAAECALACCPGPQMAGQPAAK
jgi:cobalt-zinc-cadmium efflux system protein